MARIPTYLFDGDARTGPIAPRFSGEAPAATAEAGQILAGGANRLAAGVADFAADRKRNNDFNDNFWAQQRLTDAQRKWMPWLNDAQKSGVEDVTGAFTKGYDEYTQGVIKGAPSERAGKLAQMHLDDFGSQMLGKSLIVQSTNIAQNTINGFTTQLTGATDTIAANPEMYSDIHARMSDQLTQAVLAKKIDPATADKIQAHVDSLQGEAAEAMIPKNPQRAQQILDGAKGLEWHTRKGIQTEIDNAMKTNDFLGRYQQEELLKSTVSSIMATGKTPDAFNINSYGVAFGKDQQQVRMAAAEKEIDIAKNVYVGKTSMTGQPVDQINNVLTQHAPVAGSPDYDKQLEVYKHLVDIADAQIKLIHTDPFSYSRQDPIVDAAWKQVEDLPAAAKPELRQMLTQQAIDAAVNFQKQIGIPEGMQSVMSNSQARTYAAKINAGGVQDVQQAFLQMMSNYGSHYQNAFRDMARLPDGQRIDAASQIVALHIGQPFLADFLSAIRTPDSDFKVDPADSKALKDKMLVDHSVTSLRAALTSANPGAVSYADDYSKAIEKYSLSLLSRNKAKNASDAVKMASDLIIGSAFHFTEINGSTLAIKKTQGIQPISEADVDSIKLQLQVNARTITPEEIDTAKFAFPPNLSKEVMKNSIADTLSNDAFWVTNSQNDGAVLYMNGAEGTATPIMRRDPNNRGNVNLYKQPKVKNPDGSISTVDSVSGNVDGKELLLPTVTPDGRHFKGSAAEKFQQAFTEYKKTGQYLGQFDSEGEATAYASKLHDDYAKGKYDGPAPSQYVEYKFLDLITQNKIRAESMKWNPAIKEEPYLDHKPGR